MAILDSNVQVSETDFMVEILENPVRGKIERMKQEVTSLVMTNEVAFHQATKFYKFAKEGEKQIEFIRKQLNGPDQERINARNDKAKDLLEPLKEVQRIAASKSAEYQTMLEEQKREAQLKIEEAVELFGVEPAMPITEFPKTVRSESATVFTRTIRNFRIVDPSKVPAKYLMVNEEAVKQDIKLGVNEIPGIEIYEEQVRQIRTR